MASSVSPEPNKAPLGRLMKIMGVLGGVAILFIVFSASQTPRFETPDFDELTQRTSAAVIPPAAQHNASRQIASQLGLSEASQLVYYWPRDCKDRCADDLATLQSLRPDLPVTAIYPANTRAGEVWKEALPQGIQSVVDISGDFSSLNSNPSGGTVVFFTNSVERARLRDVDWQRRDVKTLIGAF